MDPYGFRRLSVEEAHLADRSASQDVAVFSFPLSSPAQMVDILNAYLSHPDFTFPDGRSAAGYVNQLFDNALGTSTHHALLVWAALDFFVFTPDYISSMLYIGIKIHPLSLLHRLNQAIEARFAADPTLHYGTFTQIETWIQQEAALNPDCRVKYYVDYFFRSADQTERQGRLAQWCRLEACLIRFRQLSRDPTSRLAYLVGDIRHYLIEPYVENFYRFM